MRKFRLEIVGCGVISDWYFSGAAQSRFLEVVSYADLDPPRLPGGRPRHSA